MPTTKPTVGIFGLTCCAGCQLSILNCEDELLKIAEKITFISTIQNTALNAGSGNR